MITPMKKYSFLVFHKEYNEFLDHLRDQGVVHVAEKHSEQKQEKLAGQFQMVNRYKQALRFLKRREQEEKDTGKEDPATLLDQLEELQKEEEHRENRIGTLRKEISKLEPWGNYEKKTLEKLETEGYKIHLYTCLTKQFEESWEERYSIQIINKYKGTLYFAVITKAGEEVDIDAEPEAPAEHSLADLNKELKENEERLAWIKDRYDELAATCIPAFEKTRENIIKEIEYRSTLIDTEEHAEGSLKLLEGWVPEDCEEALVNFLDESDVYYISSEPGKNEKPPIKLKNNRLTRLAEPVGKLFDLPDYKEIDLTPFFGPFFMLFFGFCLGDAGYGLLFVIAGLLLRNRMRKQMKRIVTLGIFLGIATVFFGALSGTFFGINLINTGYTVTQQTLAMLGDANIQKNIIDQLQSLQGVHFEARSDFLEAVRNSIGELNTSSYRSEILKYTRSDVNLLASFRHLMQEPLNMFYLAMIIGGVQIILGKVIYIFNVIKKQGFKYSIAPAGWALLIITLVVFIGGNQFGLLDIEKVRPVYFGFLILSGALIVFFNNPDSMILVRPLSAIWDAYGVVTGVFQDILSYIRLFALGISSAVLGFVFNDISSQLLGVPYVGWLLFVILLLFGHSINIFLASLGAFIHPMRLTFVEFYKNAGFKGGGIEYKPFSK
jgi:V/A-type H+-transporting ATPase subunit I